MKINAINTVYSRQSLYQKRSCNERAATPLESPQNDTVAFKGIKNALRLGGVGFLAGAAVGLLTLPAMGLLAGAATLGSIVGAVGAVSGAQEDDKKNVLKE